MRNVVPGKETMPHSWSRGWAHSKRKTGTSKISLKMLCSWGWKEGEVQEAHQGTVHPSNKIHQFRGRGQAWRAWRSWTEWRNGINVTQPAAGGRRDRCSQCSSSARNRQERHLCINLRCRLRTGRSSMLRELNRGVKIPDLWRMSARSKTCSTDVGAVKNLFADEGADAAQLGRHRQQPWDLQGGWYRMLPKRPNRLKEDRGTTSAPLDVHNVKWWWTGRRGMWRCRRNSKGHTTKDSMGKGKNKGGDP